jgi:hypothetical protein
MAQEESKNLQKYFENDPPSFFDDLAVRDGNGSKQKAWKFVELNCHFFSEELLKVSAEVKDLWPFPDKSERSTPTVPCVTAETLVKEDNSRWELKIFISFAFFSERSFNTVDDYSFSIGTQQTEASASRINDS